MLKAFRDGKRRKKATADGRLGEYLAGLAKEAEEEESSEDEIEEIGVSKERESEAQVKQEIKKPALESVPGWHEDRDRDHNMDKDKVGHQEQVLREEVSAQKSSNSLETLFKKQRKEGLTPASQDDTESEAMESDEEEEDSANWTESSSR